ncbi:histone-lysine N-methyltransferase SETMAR-like [Ooceraea biroi]|uniref:histone-lysine N-methyltransferase SETMAR-like n=1 Tax=Ooceraea biroi TaxID=2015173 RepID=UPI000F085F4D|nr:histone-lysine N-methyltransferase SETMAR-like [Ooceraea biroi]
MEQNKQYFRYLMLFYFHKGKNATQTKEKICAVYGEDVVSERVCQNRFAEFRASDTTCEDGKRSGRPLVADDDQIKTVIENNPHYTTRDIAQIVNVSQKTVVNRLHTLGYVSRYDIWVPHNLTEKNLMDRISICDSLLKRNENNPFLKQIVTGDEKWIVYKNVERKRS